MNKELRAEFFNLALNSLPMQNALKNIPHELSDMFGHVISSQGSPAAESTEILVRRKAVAKLRAPENLGSLIASLLEATLESEFRRQEGASARDEEALLSADLGALLTLSEGNSITFEEILNQALRLLRTHVWAERSSIFCILDGFTLEGLASIGWDSEEWRHLLSGPAGTVVNSRKNYLVPVPAEDPHLKDRAGVEKLKNLACFPLLYGNTLLGVLTISNRLAGPFTEPLPPSVPRFLKLISHILQKHIYKTQMEEFGRTKETLGKYLSKKVVSSVSDTQEAQLGGIEKKVVCLFSDLRGYTTITEGIQPATLVKLLNFYFERMHAVIEQHEGTLDKIVGDLIMAVWNIPKDQPEPELLAMKAALEMQKEMLRVVVPEWQKHGVDKVGMGIGVNSGIALAGNLGSSRFMNYTVIGDAINTAQRLEAKALSGEIWMSEKIYPLVQGKIEKPIRKEIAIRLKGKEQTINAMVYRPLNC